MLEIFKKKIPSKSNFKIFSFYNEQVNPNVPIYQKRVFDKFGLTINQVFIKKMYHGTFLNRICKEVVDTDYIIVFDIDCIPLSSKWLSALLDDLLEPNTIVGCAQTANHLQDGKNLYVSPFFFGISTKYLEELNYPDMDNTDVYDSGQNLTEVIRAKGGNIKYWWPTHIEEPIWNLYHPEHSKFGLGTTYNDLVYHAFFSRDDLSQRFIEKCKSVLGEN
jgi:hypothetical protein